MKFNVLGRMQTSPTFDIDARVEPLDFDVSIQGAFQGDAGPFKAHIGNIPIRMAVPFLKRRPVIASIGGFGIDLQRFRVEVEKAGIDLSGMVGSKGIGARLNTKVECVTEMKLDGNVAGRVGLSHLDLCEENCPPRTSGKKRE